MQITNMSRLEDLVVEMRRHILTLVNQVNTLESKVNNQTCIIENQSEVIASLERKIEEIYQDRSNRDVDTEDDDDNDYDDNVRESSSHRRRDRSSDEVMENVRRSTGANQTGDSVQLLTPLSPISFNGVGVTPARISNKALRLSVGPSNSQPVTALPGIGKVLGGRLTNAGYSTVDDLHKKLLSMNKNQGRFQEWMKDVCNANFKQSGDCYDFLIQIEVRNDDVRESASTSRRRSDDVDRVAEGNARRSARLNQTIQSSVPLPEVPLLRPISPLLRPVSPLSFNGVYVTPARISNKALRLSSGRSNSQPVSALPGIGKVLGGRLSNAGYSTVDDLHKKLVEMNKNQGRFQEWMKAVCNANVKQSGDCYDYLRGL